jgi:16S rRNA (uracil1498-N3)-methyltransferase
MSVHRFYASDLCADHCGPIALAADESRHAHRVLRLSVGAAVELFNGAGCTAMGTIVDARRSTVVVDVTQTVKHPPRCRPQLEIITALPRTHRQQFLFEKATELGVAAIQPIGTARSTVRPQPDAAAKWQRYEIEAAKQCGAVYLPCITVLSSAPGFENSLSGEYRNGPRWIAMPAPDATPLADAVEQAASAAAVSVWIGPEGGFSPEELNQAISAGLLPISLGQHILRIETAVVAIAAYVALASAKHADPPT